jgi:hypothetical protein
MQREALAHALFQRHLNSVALCSRGAGFVPLITAGRAKDSCMNAAA